MGYHQDPHLQGVYIRVVKVGERRCGGIMSRNPKFIAALEEMRKTHDSKNEDYAADDNPYSNFEEAAETAGITVDQQFLSLIGVKLARLRQLFGGKTPNHESIDDTLMDLAVYSTLLYSYHLDRPEPPEPQCKHGVKPNSICPAV